MKIAVTGAAGYIGTHTVRELLSSGHHIIMIDNNHVGNGIGFLEFIGNKNVTIKIGDIRDYNFIESVTVNIDKVVHLAAIVGEPACDKDEKLANDVNILGTLNVIKACKKNKVKHLHFMSTASSYGVQNDEIVANETTAVNPISFYAKTKLDMEEAILNATNKDLYCTIFRPSTVHGMSTRMRFDLIVNTMSKHCFIDKKLSLFGLTLWRPIFWVGDAGRAINLIINTDEEIVKNQIYNCGNDSENYQIKNIGEIVASEFEDIEISYDSSFRDARSYKVDFSKFEKIGFRITKDLRKCVKEIKFALSNKIIKDPSENTYYNHLIDYNK